MISSATRPATTARRWLQVLHIKKGSDRRRSERLATHQASFLLFSFVVLLRKEQLRAAALLVQKWAIQVEEASGYRSSTLAAARRGRDWLYQSVVASVPCAEVRERWAAIVVRNSGLDIYRGCRLKARHRWPMCRAPRPFAQRECTSVA